MSKKFIHLAAFSFVDDKDIFQTLNPEDNSSRVPNERDPTDILYSETQQALNLWVNTLAATGGELETTKTFYVPIIPYWQGTKLKLDKSTSIHKLSITNSKGCNATIEKKQPDEAFFSLGMWQTPTGLEVRQKQYLLDTIEEWGAKTNLHKLTWHQARIAAKCTIGRTLVYSLSATALTEAQCNDLQKAYLKEILGKIGVVRTFPSSIAFAPVELGGLGLMSFEIEQVISHVSIILQHGPQPASVTGQLLQSSAEYNCLETGLEGDPFQLPPKAYTTENTWIKNTLASCHKYGIKIYSGITGLEKWATRDAMIMDLFSHMDDVQTLKIINKVRMYLRIITMSDLLTADGRYYDKNLFQGKRGQTNPNPSFYRYKWPHMPPPSTTERRIWHKTISNHIQMEHPTYKAQTNIEFTWKKEASIYAKWLYSETTGFIYRRIGPKSWRTWKKNNATCRQHTRSVHNTFKPEGTLEDVPDDSTIVGINKIQADCISPQYLTDRTRIAVEESHTYSIGSDIGNPDIVQIDKRYRTYLYHIVMSCGSIFTDGSYGNGRATYGVVIQPIKLSVPRANIDLAELITESGTVHGHPTYDLNSYRAELAGILCALKTTINLCNQAKITQGSCMVYCDNKGALLASFGSKRPTPRWASYDLLRQIRDQLQRSPIKWNFKHVKGHQDRTVEFASLSYEAQGNVLADCIASRELTIADTSGQQEHKRSWELRVNGNEICGNINQRISYEIHKPIMMARWSQLLCPNFTHMDKLNWDAFFRSWTFHPPHVQIQLVKYFTRTLPVGRNLKRRRHADSEACPCCGEDEDHDHIIVCKHKDMVSTFEEEYDGILAWMERNMPDSISRSVKNILIRYQNPLVDTGDIHTLHHAQLEVGQRAFVAGLWIQGWDSLLDSWYTEQGSKRSAAKWICHLINRIQLLPLAMWKKQNCIMHHTQDNEFKQQQHEHLNECIENIFRTKPHTRLMAHCDNFYFTKYTKDNIRKMKLQRKKNWVTGANLIISKYARNTSRQSARFKAFFQWDPG